MMKLIGISFCILLCGTLIKSENKAVYFILSLSGGILAFLSVSDKVSQLFNQIMKLGESIPASQSYVRLMLKVLCIVLIVGFTCDTCRDNGENALASFVETGGKVIIISMIMPLFEAVLDTVIGLIK